MKRNERIFAEIFLLRKVYEQVDYDGEDFRWVHIPYYELPPGFNEPVGELLIELPKNYPFSPPQNFFLHKDIKTFEGYSIDHYYSNPSMSKYYEKGWAWFCIHIKKWKAVNDIIQSDNLLTCIDLVYTTLSELLEETRKKNKKWRLF
jgi:hypothetical protein